tara:strand:+ start:108 stop:221 length:114 start_codon:yes stop_codon:yes gene_type:complete
MLDKLSAKAARGIPRAAFFVAGPDGDNKNKKPEEAVT